MILFLGRYLINVLECHRGCTIIITTGKKSSSRLSGGCAIIITTGKKSSSRLSGRGITTGKKSSSHLPGGCAIVITTGKKSSSRLSGGCAIVSMTEKKNSSRLSGRFCCCVSFWFWQEIGFGCTYYYVLGVPYSCGVVLFFWF